MTPTHNAIRQREYRQAHRDEIRERNASYNRARRIGGTFTTGQKAIAVEYPGCAVLDWYSKTEYERRKNEIPFGSKIWINGKLVARVSQLEMEPMK